jgi:hypothetical protein
MSFDDAFPIVIFLATLVLLHLSLNVAVGQGKLQTKVKTIFVLAIVFGIFCKTLEWRGTGTGKGKGTGTGKRKGKGKGKGKGSHNEKQFRSICKVKELENALVHIGSFRRYYESGYIDVVESVDSFAELYVDMLMDCGLIVSKTATASVGLERLVDLRQDVLNTLHQFELNVPHIESRALRGVIDKTVKVTWRCIKIIRLKTRQLGTMFPVGYVSRRGIGVQTMYQS